ncbi:putative sodium- and chloride-dependent GABA transporter 2 [Apostichopus japonicus]|uniref:Transporter n=1 Tax=Stichopus japonicus TaxID=307972 RepID=A0A2G8L3Y6_STIJA|nr:putative sodium- and chloride-dependent GABA transporter 2 [Apostichopus japonicus]
MAETKLDVTVSDGETVLQSHLPTVSSNTDDGNGERTREGWSNKFDFIVACIGYAVGLGNVWRFPYLCYKNGGGAFLVPYFISLFCCGIPLFLLEISMGQLFQQGGITVWKMFPILKGIGYSALTVAIFFCTYYIVICSWAFFFLFSSFTTKLPWGDCLGYWTDEYCNDPTLQENVTVGFFISKNGSLVPNIFGQSPAQQFWEKRVLEVSSGIDDIGNIRWELLGCLVLAWALCYVCICRGVKQTGKIVYVTALCPYIILTILLVRGATLPGAGKGIYYFITPTWGKLTSPTVWVDAATQIFFSYGVGVGSLISLGSYNDVKNNCLMDTVIVGTVNACTSLYAGFVTFSVLGYMAHQLNVEVEDVVDEGPGLTFVSYPTAVQTIPGSFAFSIIFFAMLLMLGLNTQFCVLEGIVTSIMDEFPQYNLRKRRKLLLLGICGIGCLLGIPCITQGGIYVLQLYDSYGASGMCLLWVATWECICISYGYGIKRFYREISVMLGFEPGRYWVVAWALLTPAISGGIFVFSIADYQPAKYGSHYYYPPIGQAIGLLMAIAVIQWVLSFGAWTYIHAKGSIRKRWLHVSYPQISPAIRIDPGNLLPTVDGGIGGPNANTMELQMTTADQTSSTNGFIRKESDQSKLPDHVKQAYENPFFVR